MSITTKDFTNKPMAWIQEFDSLGYLPFIWWIIDSFFHCRGSPEEPSFILTNKWLSVSMMLRGPSSWSHIKSKHVLRIAFLNMFTETYFLIMTSKAYLYCCRIRVYNINIIRGKFCVDK